jgi:topoisomerase IV subunit B
VKILEFYMGKNTPDRQDFIIDNLRVEFDRVKQEEVVGEEVES